MRVTETPEGPRTGLSGHTVDNDFDCEAIRRALRLVMKVMTDADGG